jgi:hypothetical protein
MSTYSGMCLKIEAPYAAKFRVEWGTNHTPYSGSIVVNKEACINMVGTYDIPPGTPMRIEMSVDLGRTVHSAYVTYQPSPINNAVWIAGGGVQSPTLSLSNP